MDWKIANNARMRVNSVGFEGSEETSFERWEQVLEPHIGQRRLEEICMKLFGIKNITCRGNGKQQYSLQRKKTFKNNRRGR